MDYLEQLNREIVNDVSATFDNILIEGLKRKGYEFDSRQDLEAFIKSNCRVEDYTHLKSKNFFVKDKCFLIHDYNTDIRLSNYTDKNQITITADQGRFAFV